MLDSGSGSDVDWFTPSKRPPNGDLAAAAPPTDSDSSESSHDSHTLAVVVAVAPPPLQDSGIRKLSLALRGTDPRERTPLQHVCMGLHMRDGKAKRQRARRDAAHNQQLAANEVIMRSRCFRIWHWIIGLDWIGFDSIGLDLIRLDWI